MPHAVISREECRRCLEGEAGGRCSSADDDDPLRKQMNVKKTEYKVPQIQNTLGDTQFKYHVALAF